MKTMTLESSRSPNLQSALSPIELAIIWIGTNSVTLAIASRLGWLNGRVLSIVITLSTTMLILVCFRSNRHKFKVLRVRRFTPTLYFFPVFPSFNYLAGDKDPGVYTAISKFFLTTGKLDINYMVPTWLAGMRVDFSPGALVPGIWQLNSSSDLYRSQFPEFWSICMAQFAHFFGKNNGFILTGVVSCASIFVFFQITEKLTSNSFAHISTLLFTLNILVLWQSKFPTTESLSLLLFLLILRNCITRFDQDLSSCAIFAALMFCNRIEGILIFALIMPYVLIQNRANRIKIPLIRTSLITLLLLYGFIQAFVLHPKYTSENFSLGKTDLLIFLIFLSFYSIMISGEIYEKYISARKLILIINILFSLVFITRLFILSETERDLFQFGVASDLFIIPTLITATYFIIPILGFLGFFLLGDSIDPLLRKFIYLIAPLFVIYLSISGVAPRMMWWGRRYTWFVIPLILILGLYFVYLGTKSKRFELKFLSYLVLIFSMVLAVSTSKNLILFEEFDGLERQIKKINSDTLSSNWIVINRNDCCSGPAWTLATPLIFSEKRNVLLIATEEIPEVVRLGSTDKRFIHQVAYIFDQPQQGFICNDYSAPLKRWAEDFPSIPTNWKLVENSAYLCKLQIGHSK